MTAAANPAQALLDRLVSRVHGDLVLAEFADSRRPRLGFEVIEFSGVDLVACVVARAVLPETAATIALVLPRGQHGLTVLLGAYFARWHRLRGLPGSVAVVSRSTRLRERARELRVPDGAFGESVPLARLGAFPDPGGRLRAAGLPFDGNERHGLSQNHRYLLFQRPDVAPVLAQNVVSTVVIDATESAVGAWEQLYERHCGKRRQVWVGELGNAEFEDFCLSHEIPIFRFDWDTIAAASAALGAGGGPFTTAALCQRAATLNGPGLRLCCHEEFDDELRELSRRLALVHEVGRDEDEVPQPVRQAMRLSMLYRRLACPVSAYDEQASQSRFVQTSAALLRAVEDAPRAAFRGRWKRAYDSHWGVVKGSARRLRELAAEECPKWWAVTERVFEAREKGETLRVVCQTQAEQAALARCLVGEGLVEIGELGAAVDVVTFADKLLPGDDANLVTVYTAPLPPWRAAAYLSGERGRVEVFCYTTERRALVDGFERAWVAAAGVERNHALLDELQIGVASGPVEHAGPAAAGPEIVELEPFTFDGSDGGAHVPIDEPDKVKEFWQRAVDLYGQNIEAAEAAAAADGDGASRRGPVLARLVAFPDGSAVYLDESVDYDVIVGGGKDAAPRIRPMPPRRLVAGMRLALLPGAARGSLVNELMSTWDEQLETAAVVYDGLWRTALLATAERLGIDGIARRLGVTEQTVEIWLSGEGWPQQRRWMVDILEQSRDAAAWENRAAIIFYIRHTRGMHRLIGRVLNLAVTETVVKGGGRAARQLEQIVGQDLSDLFSAVRVLVVVSVSEPVQVAAAQVGQFVEDASASARGAA